MVYFLNEKKKQQRQETNLVGICNFKSRITFPTDDRVKKHKLVFLLPVNTCTAVQLGRMILETT